MFKVEYSDKMYNSLVYYVDAKSALKAKNYSFRITDTGFSLFKDGTFFNETKMGAFSAPFLNAWISDSIKGLILFPVGFGMVHPRELQGQLANYSAEFMKETAALNVTDAQADVGIVEIFMSNEIVTTGKEGLFMLESKSVSAISRVDFEDDGKVSFDEESECDDSSSDSDSDADNTEETPFPEAAVEGATAAEPKKKEPKPPKERTERKAVPFYYVIAMEKRGKKLDKLPKIWRKKIEADGLSSNFKDGRLYVSNTKGASYGLPPAPHHIYNLPRLNLSLDDWETPLATDRPKTLFVKPGAAARSGAGAFTGNEDWVTIVEQFLAEPCFATFQVFRDSTCIARAYESHKTDLGYKMGSNKNPLSRTVRHIIQGEENAVTWPEFTDLLRSTARPNDTKGLMLFLFKFRLYVAQTTEGKIYVTE